MWHTVGMERSFFWVFLVVPAHAYQLGETPDTVTCCGRCYNALIADFPSLRGRAYERYNAYDWKAVTDRCNDQTGIYCDWMAPLQCNPGYQSMDCLNIRWTTTNRCEPINSACYQAMRESYKTTFGYYPALTGPDQAILTRACADCYDTTKTCPIGQEKKACQDLRWYSQGYCQPCPTGSYRNNLNQAKCVLCKICDRTETEDTPCTTISDRVCSCRTPETFKSLKVQGDPTSTFCPTCRTCTAPTQRMKSDCSFTADRVCETCPLGSKTRLDNKQDCLYCIDGYFPDPGVCTLCMANNTGCGTNQYIDCTGGIRTCPVCDGHNIQGGTLCASGRGVARKCDGSSLVNPPCQDCGPGLERPEGTPMVEGVYQACRQCGTGKYKATTGTGNCADCMNKPPNSAYRAWNAISEVASTSDCPW